MVRRYFTGLKRLVRPSCWAYETYRQRVGYQYYVGTDPYRIVRKGIDTLRNKHRYRQQYGRQYTGTRDAYYRIITELQQLVSGYRYSLRRNLLNCLVQVRARTELAGVPGIGMQFVPNFAEVFGGVMRPYRKNTGAPGIS